MVGNPVASPKCGQKGRISDGGMAGVFQIICRCCAVPVPAGKFSTFDRSVSAVFLPVPPAAWEFAKSATGQEFGKVGAGGTATAGTKSALSWHQVEILRKCLVDTEIADLMAIAECADRTEYAEGAGGRLHWPRTWRVLEKEVIRVKECNREGN